MPRLLLVATVRLRGTRRTLRELHAIATLRPLGAWLGALPRRAIAKGPTLIRGARRTPATITTTLTTTEAATRTAVAITESGARTTIAALAPIEGTRTFAALTPIAALATIFTRTIAELPLAEAALTALAAAITRAIAATAAKSTTAAAKATITATVAAAATKPTAATTKPAIATTIAAAATKAAAPGAKTLAAAFVDARAQPATTQRRILERLDGTCGVFGRQFHRGMRLVEVHGTDAVTGNAGLVGNRAHDVANTDLVALADTEEHTLLATSGRARRCAGLTA